MSTDRLFDKINSIKLRSVSKKYNGVYAVSDLDLDIIGGELLILIGSSGSGKTTTLKMINGLISPDKGSIEINGKNIKNFDQVALRRNIGYVIQQIGLFPHYTVSENIGIIPKLEGWNKDKILSRVKRLLELVDLPADKFKDRYPKELSGGQQQRVGLARSLAMDPPLLLMDEPFGALDPILRKQLQEEFLKIKKELGRTIVFVTHDIEEAFKLGDRIAIMDKSKLLQVDSPKDLILNPKNDLVASLVDSNHKFKHIDNLEINEIMMRIDDKYFFDSSLNIKNAIKRMKINNVEMGLVIKKSKFFGIITMTDLIKKTTDLKIENITSESLTFDYNESVSTVLEEMKNKKIVYGIVFKKDRPIGVVFPNEIVLKLI